MIRLLWMVLATRSEALHVVERFRRRDFGHVDVQVTIDDPKIYTKPFSVKLTELLLPDSDILEYFCNENERDGSHSGKMSGSCEGPVIILRS